MGNNDKPLGMSGGVPAGELLPCPKCNGEGSLRVSNDGEAEWVRCKSCQHEGAVHWTAEKAITAWNTRATPTPPIEGRDADVERVRAALDAQMEAQQDDTLPSSLHRDAGRVWLEGWFDLRAALQALGERVAQHLKQENAK